MYTGRTWWLRARQRSIVVLVLSLLVGWLVVTPPVPQPASAEGSLEVALLPAGLIPLDVNDRGEVLGRRGGQLELWSADATHTITSSFADAYLGPDGSVVYKRGSGDDVVVWLGPDDERTLAAPPGEALEIVPIIAPECEHLPDPFEFDHCWTLANVAVPLTLGRPVGNTADGVIVEHGPDETDAYASRYRPPAYGQSPIEGIHYEVYAVAPDGRVLGENMNIGLVTVSASGMELYPDPPPAPHQVQKMSSAGHLVVNDSGVYRVWHEGGYLPIPEGWTNAMAVNRDGVQLLSGRDEGVWKIGISHPELGVLDVRELLPSTGEFEELGPSLDIIDARRQTITDGCRFVVHATIAGVDRHLLVHLDGCAVGELEVAWSDAPGPDGVDLGDEFAMTATVTNRGAEAVSDLTLVGGSGLDLPDGIEIVDGPTWNAPASLAPGSSVDVSYVLEAVGVGEREVRIDVAASSGGGSLSADATSMVTVCPPVEASLTTSSGEEHTVVEVSLTNLWTEPLLDVRIDALVGEPASGLDIVSGPTGPNGEDAAGVDHELPPDETLAVTYEVALTGEPQLTAWLSFEDEETRTRFELPVSERDPLGLFVLLDATSDGDEIDVTVTVRNTSEEELTDVAFEAGGDDEPGLLYDPDAYEPERRGDIEVVSGPMRSCRRPWLPTRKRRPPSPSTPSTTATCCWSRASVPRRRKGTSSSSRTSSRS